MYKLTVSLGGRNTHESLLSRYQRGDISHIPSDSSIKLMRKTYLIDHNLKSSGGFFDVYWANSLWYILHTIHPTLHYTNDVKNNLLVPLTKLMPCPQCRTHLTQNLLLIDKVIPEGTPWRKASFLLHNMVNSVTGHPQYSESEFETNVEDGVYEKGEIFQRHVQNFIKIVQDFVIKTLKHDEKKQQELRSLLENWLSLIN